MGSGLLPKSSVISSLCDEVPSHIYSKIASRAQRIFDQQCKKTFATISANNGLLHCSRHHPYSITSSTQTSSVSVHTAAAVGIFAHWPYVLTSTSEFEYGQGHREVVQPDQRVRIYSTGERGWEGRFRSHLGG